MIEKNLNLVQFASEIREKIKDPKLLSYFNDTTSYYDMSLGGCSCSRKTREKYAEDKFIEKINKLDSNILLEVKTALGLQSEDVLNFTDKEGSLIKKV
jgi:hypothetical protein